MKFGIRVLGIDDAPFSKNTKTVLVVGVVYRSNIIEGILCTKVRKDGRNSTKKLLEMVNNSKFKSQIKVLFIHSITLAGFNIIDINKLSKELEIPIITITRKKPDMKEVEKALLNFKDWKRRLNIIKKAGTVHKYKAYMQLAGINLEESKKILKGFAPIPEPIRLAHLIASGIVRGESKGKT